MYDAKELAIRGAGGGALGGRRGGPSELLLELDDWVQFRVRGTRGEERRGGEGYRCRFACFCCIVLGGAEGRKE